ncbi:putative baseplate assembly protein [Streptomyces sp. NPDC016845]|uniref:putative baseplate assembly protein n=1 Tax=Streptomyces sp. NPDC016845 TaxID=3364972 RepID=UPI0037895F0F
MKQTQNGPGGATECHGTQRRRADVRAARLNGVDGVEVSDDGRTLTVTFLGRAPRHIGPENVRIDGGRRVTGIRAVDVSAERAEDPDYDDLLHVALDRAGDTSTYRLSVVESAAYGRPGTRPYHGFDPRYGGADFTFGPSCPTALDCSPVPRECPPARAGRPVIDYTARDYDSLRRLLLDRMSLTTPALTERHVPDLGVTLVELLAHTADRLAYQQDAVATEAYLDTARRRVSVRRHVRLVDYAMHDGCNARAFVALETEREVELRAGTYRFAAVDVSGLDPRERPDLGTVVTDEDLDALAARADVLEIFEPLHTRDVTVRPQHNAIRFWAWGDEECSLPVGATSATLRDAWTDEDSLEGTGRARLLDLGPGDLLLVEEVLGPRTGAPADADPAHRQAVRLTSVTPLVDELYDQPVVEVAWDDADALTFPVTLSARGGPDCRLIDGISLVRGNVVPADHGRSLTFCGTAAERFRVPPEPVTLPPCGPPDSGCGDRDGGSATAQDLHRLLALAEAGHQLTPGQVREARGLVGEEAVTRAGIGTRLHIAAGSDPEERVAPPTADAQADALRTLLAQVTYPGLPVRFRPVLRGTPVTQAAPYPDPRQIAAAQARLLVTIPERVRARLEELWRKAREHHELSRSEIAELTVLFGAQVLDEVRPADHPARALRDLLSRRDRLLAGKLRRLAVLVARARAGTVLDARTAWEVRHCWGRAYAHGLHPAEPALTGPAAALAAPDPRTALPAVTAAVGDEVWTPRRDLLSDGRRERHFVGELEDDGRLALRFGDGRHGAPPPPGADLDVSYRTGNGPDGNVGAESINHLVFCAGHRERPEGVVRVRNPLPAVGGTAPESLADVRQFAPLALRRTRLRAVTADDYAELATAVPGVQRAAADLRWTGSVVEVHVAVDPLGDAASSADARLLDAVADTLERYRRIGHDVVVHPARTVPLDIELTVCVAPGRQRGHVLAALRRALGTTRLPDGRTGLFHPDALTFGDPVRVSRLVAAAAAVPGVLSARVTRLRRLFRDDDGELEAGVLPLGPLEIAQCDNDPDRPENGRLSLVIGGGR